MGAAAMFAAVAFWVATAAGAGWVAFALGWVFYFAAIVARGAEDAAACARAARAERLWRRPAPDASPMRARDGVDRWRRGHGAP